MGLGLSIVTPAGVALETEVDWVVVPGAEGEFGVLPEHETFLAALRPGVVRYSTGTGRVAVSSGFAEVTGEQVTLLVQTAERADRVDRGRAEAARRRAEEALRYTTPDTPEAELARLRDDLERANARLEASS